MVNIQGVSRLEDITAAGDFLGLFDQEIHINMCPISDGYGVMGIF
jgi:short-subunit dehydrogenase involved in D-alanine esterification of teichoic acids